MQYAERPGSRLLMPVFAILLGLSACTDARPAPAGEAPRSAIEQPSTDLPTDKSPPSLSSAQPTITPVLPLAGRIVVLDPGHNRDNARHPSEIRPQVDAGGFSKQCNTTGTATSTGIPESTVNWLLAVELRDRLTELGADVVLTRQGDEGWGPCIDERAQTANRAGAHLLLSLHADGSAPDHRGFHVIAPGLVSGFTDDIVAESNRAAEDIRDGLVAAGFFTSDYVGEAGIDIRTDLGTLNRADVPAVMLEAGNLRNAADAALLTGDEGRSGIAEALSQAVVAFLVD